ncbi:hypothetical protein GCM10029964_039710 [Kibdelosporangium lantanae]
MDGVRIGKGEPVSAAMVAASRDPHVFAEPETLDLTRDAGGHLAFGHGPHFCLGASLARVETEIALTRLFTRFPKMAVREARRAPDGGRGAWARCWSHWMVEAAGVPRHLVRRG